jgi:putative ABC transport system substrate-binding protein
MRRRAFITLLGGAAAWPLAARAQQPAMPVIGWLDGRSADAAVEEIAAARQALRQAGFSEGQNIAIEYRWADGQYHRLPALAAELVTRQVGVLAAVGGPASAHAAKAATSTIPIVFTSGADPVKSGLVASLNRPGGNLTGVHLLTTALDPKRLELLHEVVSSATAIAVLVNPTYPDLSSQVGDLEAAARAKNRQITILKANNVDGIDAAFETIAERRIGGLLVASDPFLSNQSARVIALTKRHKVPAISLWRAFAVEGGLMSYGTSLSDAYRQAGFYMARILGGEKPADLPVHQATKVELVINLKTAKALGLTIPLPLLARAEHVIE